MKKWGAIIVGTLCLLWVALYNRFPLVAPDTMEYLGVAHFWKISPNRPLGYSFFLAFFSAPGSLWGVIVAQAGLFAWLFWEALPNQDRTFLFLISTIAASVLTPLSWTLSQLMADALTPIGLLSLLVLSRTTRRILPSLILFISSIAHFSHLPIFFGAWLFFRTKWALGVLCLSLVFLLSTRSGSIGTSLLMGRIYETGILRAVLERGCKDHPWEACRWQGSQRQGSINYFLWDRRSAHYGYANLEKRNREYDELLLSTIWMAPGAVVGQTIRAIAKQFLAVRPADGIVNHFREPIFLRQLQVFYPADLWRYFRSRQAEGDFHPDAAIRFTRWATLVGLGAAWVFVSHGSMAPLLAALLLNSIVCGFFTGGFDRYQARLVGLIVLTAIVMFVELLRENEIVFFRAK